MFFSASVHMIHTIYAETMFLLLKPSIPKKYQNMASVSLSDLYRKTFLQIDKKVWVPLTKQSHLRHQHHHSMLGLSQLLNVMTQFKSRTQLQSHVLHNDITAQQHQSLAVDLLQRG